MKKNSSHTEIGYIYHRFGSWILGLLPVGKPGSYLIINQELHVGRVVVRTLPVPMCMSGMIVVRRTKLLSRFEVLDWKENVVSVERTLRRLNMVDFPRTLLLRDMEFPSVVHKPSNGRQTGSTREKLPFWVCASVQPLRSIEVLLARGKRKLLWRLKTRTKCQQTLAIRGKRKLLSHFWRTGKCTTKWVFNSGFEAVACRGLVVPGVTAWLDAPYQLLVLNSGVWYILLLDISCLWRHNVTSYSRLQSRVLAKFVDATCILVVVQCFSGISRANFYDLKTLDNMNLSFRKYDFIWPIKSERARTCIYCTKKHFQKK